MILNDSRKEDVLYFMVGRQAQILTANGRHVPGKHYFEKSQVIGEICTAVLKDNLKKATKIYDGDYIKYFFRLDKYDKRKKEKKKSAVQIVIPKELYAPKDPYIQMLNSVTKYHIKVRKNKKKLRAAIAMGIVLTISNVLWKANANTEMDVLAEQAQPIQVKNEMEVIPEESIEYIENDEEITHLITEQVDFLQPWELEEMGNDPYKGMK